MENKRVSINNLLKGLAIAFAILVLSIGGFVDSAKAEQVEGEEGNYLFLDSEGREIENTEETLGISYSELMRAVFSPDMSIDDETTATFIEQRNGLARSKNVLVAGKPFACAVYDKDGVCESVVVKMSINGEDVFCIQAYVAANFDKDAGYKFKETKPPYLNRTQREELNMLAYAFGLINDKSDDMYFAMQLRVWEITDNLTYDWSKMQKVRWLPVCPEPVEGGGGCYSSWGADGNKLGLYPKAPIQAKWDKLDKKIKEIESQVAEVPKFSGTEVSLAPGESVTLNGDVKYTNPVAKSNNPKVSASISKDGKLTLKLNEMLNANESVTIVVEETAETFQPDMPLLVYSTGNKKDQDVAPLNHRLSDPIADAKITIKMETGGFRLQKNDQRGKLSKAGFEYQVATDKDFKNVLATKKTNAQGVIDFDNLPANVDLFLKETKTVEGHKLNPEVKKFQVKPGTKPSGHIIDMVDALETRALAAIKEDDGTVRLGNDHYQKRLNGAKIEVTDTKSGALYAEGKTGEQHYKVSNQEPKVGELDLANKKIQVFDKKDLKGDALFSVTSTAEGTIEITPGKTLFKENKQYYLAADGKLVGEPKPMSLEEAKGIYTLDGIYFDEELTVEEVEAPATHLMRYDAAKPEVNVNRKNIKFNLPPKDIKPIMFENKRRNGYLVLHKLDEFNNLAQPGQTFQIAKDAEFNDIVLEFTNEESGVVELDEPFAEGTYFLRETEVTKEYNPTDQVLEFKVRNGFVEREEFVNTAVETEINLIKVDADNNEVKLNDATFAVYDTTNKGCLVDEDHNVSVFDRDRDTAYDYEAAQCVEDEEYEGEKIFSGKTGEQYIKVYDQDNHRLPGKFEDVIISKDQDLADVVDVVKTDENGVANITELPTTPGKYYYGREGEVGTPFIFESEENMEGKLKIPVKIGGRKITVCEVGLPEGYEYMPDQDICYELDADTENVIVNDVPFKIENMKKKVRTTIYKKDHYDEKQLLNGAVFQVWNTNDEKDEYVGEFVTGSLTIKEGKVKDMEEETSVIEIDGNIAPELETVEDPIEGVKYNIFTAEDFEAGKTEPYKVLKTNEDGEIIIELPDGKYYVNREDEVDEDGKLIVEEHNVAKGAIEVPALNYGEEYTVCEIMAPKGYELPGDNCQKLRPIDEDGNLEMTVKRTNKLRPTPAMREENGLLPSILPFWFSK